MFESIFGKQTVDVETAPSESSTLSPFQSEMQNVRSALATGRILDAYNALEKVDPCKLNDVEAELNRDDNNAHDWYSTSLEAMHDNTLRLSVHRINHNKVVPVLSTRFFRCTK